MSKETLCKHLIGGEGKGKGEGVQEKAVGWCGPREGKNVGPIDLELGKLS